ncbi:hypothetical protein [Dyella dinghuensis]|uniref:hypothetical protein n=1 Tax=Dyella dinghuensis TaxID=1920169 RepID=UPI000F865AD1|nr:hypothetical protein [Dyella dinghuensis]
MNQSLSSAIRYGVVCMTLLAIAQFSPLRFTDRFYQFDRVHVFVPTFYVALLIVGFFVRPYATTVLKVVLFKGSISGVLAGIFAYFVTILANRHGLDLFHASAVFEVVASLLFTLIVFFTPLLGIVSALITRFLILKKVRDST